MLTTILLTVLIAWAFLFVCSIPVIAALMRSSQVSQAEESKGHLAPEQYEPNAQRRGANDTKKPFPLPAFTRPGSQVTHY